MMKFGQLDLDREIVVYGRNISKLWTKKWPTGFQPEVIDV
jgi:hypothetical protein